MDRARIFVSYAHKDARWLTKLKSHLGVLEHEGLVDVWSDRSLSTGDEFFTRIDEEMRRARIAILMISSDFLSSSFVRSVEVPLLLERHKNSGMRVLPILVRDCAWQSVPWLARLQLRPTAAVPLANQPKNSDRALADFAKEVASILRPPADPFLKPLATAAALPGGAPVSAARKPYVDWAANSVREFHRRISFAFPGVREQQVYDSAADAIARLERFFGAEALKPSDTSVWWFRGDGCNHVSSARVVASDKVLLDGIEIRPARLVVYRPSSPWYNLIYLEASPEASVGKAAVRLEHDGEPMVREEYGWLDGRPITLEEHDDGIAVIDGQFVDAEAS